MEVFDVQDKVEQELMYHMIENELKTRVKGQDSKVLYKDSKDFLDYLILQNFLDLWKKWIRMRIYLRNTFLLNALSYT